MRFEVRNHAHEKKEEALLQMGLTTTPVAQIMFTDEPKFPEYYCVARNSTSEKSYGRGHSTSHSLSRLKAVAECIERMALYFPKRKWVRTRFQEDGDYIDPADLVNFSDGQMKGRREKYLEKVRASRFLWERGVEHTKRRNCLVPAQVVHLTSEFNKEPSLREQNTSGAALGFSFESAFYRGLTEVVERDAFMINYLTKNSSPRIDYSSSRYLSEFAEYLHRYNLEFDLFDITTDLKIPAVMAVSTDKTGIGPGINFGAGADVNMETAAIRAAHECVMARSSFRLHKKVEGIPKITGKKIANEMDRAFYWYPVERIGDVEFLLSSSEEVKLKTYVGKQREKLNVLLSVLREMGYKAISVDVSQPEVLKVGGHVVKAVVPELHPLYLGESFKTLYSVHAGELPDLGLPPHPFL